MSSSVIERGGKILLPLNLKERLGMNDGDEVDIELFGSSLLIRPKKNKPINISSLKGCVHDNETDPLTLKSIWKM
ncbi:MAG: AbrB/MazE/SpoVT family DNA-binding domain-containing protein [Methanobacteriota archaeon]